MINWEETLRSVLKGSPDEDVTGALAMARTMRTMIDCIHALANYALNYQDPEILRIELSVIATVTSETEGLT